MKGAGFQGLWGFLVFSPGLQESNRVCNDITIAILLSVCQVLAHASYIPAALSLHVYGLEVSIVFWRCSPLNGETHQCALQGLLSRVSGRIEAWRREGAACGRS